MIKITNILWIWISWPNNLMRRNVWIHLHMSSTHIIDIPASHYVRQMWPQTRLIYYMHHSHTTPEGLFIDYEILHLNKKSEYPVDSALRAAVTRVIQLINVKVTGVRDLNSETDIDMPVEGRSKKNVEEENEQRLQKWLIIQKAINTRTFFEIVEIWFLCAYY